MAEKDNPAPESSQGKKKPYIKPVLLAFGLLSILTGKAFATSIALTMEP